MQETAADHESSEYVRSQRVQRDIAFFFHQQSEVSSIEDDLDYSFFEERYWDVLVEDQALCLESQRALLAILFAMGLHEAGNVGLVLGDNLLPCISALENYSSGDPINLRMKEIALQALVLAAEPQDQRDWRAVEGLLAEGRWMHQVSVVYYFQTRIRQLLVQ